VISDALIDSMLKLVDGFYKSVGAVQTGSNTKVGAQVTSNWTNVAGLEAVPCRVAPLIEDRPASREDRREYATVGRTELHIALRGYYPTINSSGHRFLVDGVRYNITAVEHDGNKKRTRLRVELVKPDGV
jgi:hypothetical protein